MIALDEVKIAELLKTDKKVYTYYFEECESTSTYLKKYRSYMPALVVANEQTKGRGQVGKAFFSPAGGLYMSLARNVSCTISKIPEVTTVIGEIVSKEINVWANVNTEIRKINDIYLNDKKVAGILCELMPEGPDWGRLIIGIGINISATEEDFKNVNLSDIATSLNMPEGDRNILAAAITDKLLELKFQ